MAARAEDVRGHRSGARARASRSPPASTRSRPSSGPTTPPSPTTTTRTRRSRSAGTPRELVLEDGVSVRVRTESELGATHSVFFNRGAIASQEYARRFMNLAPDQLTDPRERAAAYKWLSRGLLEALLAFIARATGPEFALRGAIYEFRPRGGPAGASRRPRSAGSTRRSSTTASTTRSVPNEQAIAANGIAALCSPRTRGSIMHNKFLVLLRDGEPEAVWTGSTNISENGLFGQLNAGHQVEDATVARAFRDYWDQLRANPAPKDLKTWVAANSPPPPVPAPAGTTTVMSPRRGLRAARRLRDRGRQRAARAVHDVRVRHEPALPRRLPAPRRRAARRADGEGGQRPRARRGPDLHRQAAPAAQRPGRGRQEQERHRARQLEARAHRRDRHQRRLGAHQVHARRPARARPDRRHRLGQLQRGQHGHQRREHARDPRRHARRRHLPRRVHALLLRTTPSARR